MFPTLEVNFDFFYSLTKRIHNEGDSCGLLKEATSKLSITFRTWVKLPAPCLVLHNNSEHKSFAVQLCPVLMHWIIHLEAKSRVPPWPSHNVDLDYPRIDEDCG
jgi:hypothetical protein